MPDIHFSYFHGPEAEQYSFYRVPKVLFTSEHFKGLSCEAKVLYGLMLDRMSLSIKNGWLDEEQRVYIIFTVEEIMDLLGCKNQKAVKLLKELDDKNGIGLIEKRRLGMGKPNVIYVKNFIIEEQNDTVNEEKKPENAENSKKCENHTSRNVKITFQEIPESHFKKCENHTSGNVKITPQEVWKSHRNNTDINKTDYSKTDNQSILSYLSGQNKKIDQQFTDAMDEMDVYRELIKKNIDYDCFAGSDSWRQQDVDELVELIVEVMSMPDDSYIRIAGVDKPAAIVKNRFLKLNYANIEYVLFSMSRNTAKVGNIKAYLLTALYNSSMTMRHYYQAEVNHDMADPAFANT